MYLTPDQVQVALKNLLKRVESDVPLQFGDSNKPGDKWNQANWGLCTQDKEIFPDKDMIKHDLVKYRNEKCPFDQRDEEVGYGCFYQCRIFQGPIPNKQEAIELIQLRIKK